ncbi:hypothetical protein AB5N19_08335 [Seiridium cardinale]
MDRAMTSESPSRSSDVVDESMSTDIIDDIYPCDSISEKGSHESLSIRPGSGSHGDTSATTWSTTCLLNLPFLQKLPPVEGVPHLQGLPHYRLILDIDRKIEAATIQTPFGPLVAMPSDESNRTSEGTVTPQAHSNSCSVACEPIQPGDTDSGQRPQPNGADTGSISSMLGRSQSESLDGAGGLRESPEDVDQKYSRAPPPTPTEPTSEPERFRNNFLEIRPSATAGFGAFALKNMIQGQIILIEKSLFRANNNTLYDEIEKLTPSLLQAYDRMHAHVRRAYEGGPRNRAAIFRTNSFFVSPFERGVYLTASKFNHACKPINNVTYIHDQRQDCIIFSTERDIEAGEELFINYGPDPETLYTEYGFICRCGGCGSLTDVDIAGLEHPIR